MPPPAPEALRDRLAATPAGGRLLDSLADTPEAWLVGGAVRDLIRGEAPLDLDVVIEGDAVAAARHAAARLGGEAVVHDRFGTATVRAEGIAFDVATARSETYAAPGALPDVAAADLATDLARRDFTVNAIALGLAEPRLEAAPWALEDLEAGLLRVLHPASFTDDPTRLLRLVRYASRLRFEPELATERLARDAVRDAAPATVSLPRMGAELLLLTAEPAAAGALDLAAGLGLAAALHPSLRPDSALHRSAAGLLGAPSGLLALAAACTEFEPGELRGWLDGLGFPAAVRDTVLAAALDSLDLAGKLAAATRPSAIAAIARGRPAEAIAMAGALGAQDAARRWLEELRHVTLLIGGEDLIAAGVPEGPEVGRGLAAALAAKLDSQTEGRDAELAAALAAVRD